MDRVLTDLRVDLHDDEERHSALKGVNKTESDFELHSR